MSRFFVPKEAVKGNFISISGKEAHHILDVMRLKESDSVVAFDGTGKEYVGFIREAKRKSLLMEIVEKRKPSGETKPRITLVQSILKKDKMDYIVEKSTELGAYSVIPILTERTIPSWDEAKMMRSVERWRKIAKESAKQCGRVDVPRIDSVRGFDDIIKDASDYNLSLIAALSDDAIRLKDAIANFKGDKIQVLIGPEGDFTPDEVAKAKARSLRLVNLGSNVLRSDTAGLAVLAILEYELSS